MSGKRSNEVVQRRVWDDFGEKKEKAKHGSDDEKRGVGRRKIK